jgi:hypothetical protein
MACKRSAAEFKAPRAPPGGARQRLVRELRARRKPTAPRPRIWERLTIRRPRPVVLTRTPPTEPVVAGGAQTPARRAG